MVTIRRKSDFKKNFYEQSAWLRGRFVCGVDEVGRGCLVGPVVAAAVIIRTKKISTFMQDSKKLTPEERLRGYEWIGKNCWYGVGIAHHRLIDRLNIYQATACAMRRAIMQLQACVRVDTATIVVDAVPLEIGHFGGDIVSFPFGESKSVSIAAASIVAKVTRDRLMQRLDVVFPGYALGRHKGYATQEHRKNIEARNKTIIHRTSFMCAKHQSDDTQLSFLNTNASEYSHDII